MAGPDFPRRYFNLFKFYVLWCILPWLLLYDYPRLAAAAILGYNLYRRCMVEDYFIEFDGLINSVLAGPWWDPANLFIMMGVLVPFVEEWYMFILVDLITRIWPIMTTYSGIVHVLIFVVNHVHSLADLQSKTMWKKILWLSLYRATVIYFSDGFWWLWFTHTTMNAFCVGGVCYLYFIGWRKGAVVKLDSQTLTATYHYRPHFHAEPQALETAQFIKTKSLPVIDFNTFKRAE